MDLDEISITLFANKLDERLDIRRCDTIRKNRLKTLISTLNQLKQHKSLSPTVTTLVTELEKKLVELWDYCYVGSKPTPTFTLKLINELIEDIRTQLQQPQQPIIVSKDELTIIVQGAVRKLLTIWSKFAEEKFILNVSNGIYAGFYQGQAQNSPEAKLLIPAHQYMPAEEYKKIVDYFKTTIEQTYKEYNVKFDADADEKWYWFKLWGSSRQVTQPKAYEQRLYCNVQVKYLPLVLRQIINALVTFLQRKNNIPFMTGDVYVRGKIPKDEQAAVDRVDPLVIYVEGNNPNLCDLTYKEIVKEINTLPQEYTNQAKNALGKKEGMVTTVPDVTPQQFNIAKQAGYKDQKISYGQYVSLALAYAIIKTYNFSTFKQPLDENDLTRKVTEGIPFVRDIIKNTFLIKF